MTPPSSESDGLRITTLGALAAFVTSPAGLRQLGRSKPVALLAYLTAAPGRRASRERLASLLWSEGSSEQARQNLRQTIWYIRRRLGAVIHGEDDTVAIEGDVVCDRFEFLRAVREHRLADAVELYAGDFIPEFAAPGAAEFEEWADVERRRLRGMFVACCDTLAREALTAGQFSQAVALARRARDVAPMDLASWRLLLEALAAARDQLGCVAELEHLDAQLAAAELAPDANLRAAMRAAQEVGRRDAVAGSDVGGLASGQEPAGLGEEFTLYAADLIGREQEFRSLLGRWEGAMQGRGGAVLVTGVAGLGKSRLLMDVHARLRASRARALFIRANLGDRAVAGGFVAAVAEALAQRPGAAAVSSESAAVLVALAPSLSSVFAAARADAATGADAERRRVSALLDLLRAVSEERPLALLIDDVHWADEESRRVLDAVTARVQRGRVLLVLSARPPIESLGGFAALDRIELQHFDAARVAEFLSRVGPIPSEPWAAELPVHLLGASRGLPLTLIELLQRLVDTHALALTETGWTSADPRKIAEVLREGMVLEARVRSLAPAARETLLLLATLARPVAATDALRALQMEGGTASAAPFEGGLVELEHRGFVSRSDGTIGVVHDEVGAAALATSATEERRVAHARAARVLLAAPDSERSLQLAAAHAASADDLDLLRTTAMRYLRSSRADGRDGSAASLIDRMLGVQATPALRRALLRRVPWWRRPSQRLTRAVAALVLLATAGAAWKAITPTALPEYEVFLRLQDGSGRVAKVTVPRVSQWEAGAPLEAELVDEAKRPDALSLGEHSVLWSTMGGREYVGHTALPDSNGGEVFLVDASGRLRWLAPHPGDDHSPSMSPDGRYIMWGSARWNPDNDRANLAMLDRRSGAVTRVLEGPHIYGAPVWSPDGTRVAFFFNSFTDNVPLKSCVMTLDADDIRCDWEGVPGSVVPHTWVDANRLLLRDGVEEVLYELDLGSGRGRQVSGPTSAVGTADHRIVAGYVESSGRRTAALHRVDQSGPPRPIFLGGAPIDAEYAASTSRRRPRFVDGVRVEVPPGGIPLDQRFGLRLSAFDSAGVPMPVHAARFTSLDTSVAVVSDGVLRPRRVGRVRIVGTAGGWRSDTAELTIVPSGDVELLEERWGADWEQRWRGFGDPQPRRGTGDGGAVINPNGDGKYPSGFYLRRSIPAGTGVGVEMRLSLPYSEKQWQQLSVSLSANSPNEPALQAWDHRTLGGPQRLRVICGVPFGGEGGDGMSRLNLYTGGRSTDWIATPRGLFEGRWFTARLQLFPDGRCGLAIDGRVVLLSQSPAALPDSVMLTVTGHSVRTEVRVGRTSVWAGVKGGVEWGVSRP